MSHTREASLPSQAWPAFRILGGYGVPTEINGPYRNLPAPNEVAPGNTFHCAKINNVEQWEVILQANRAANDGGIRSDLAGFEFPCKVCGKLTKCTEKTELKATSVPYVYDPDEAQVHHCVRAKDLRNCYWGTNAYKNAVVISGRLNQYLKNKYPSADEVNWVNNVPAYTP